MSAYNSQSASDGGEFSDPIREHHVALDASACALPEDQYCHVAPELANILTGAREIVHSIQSPVGHPQQVRLIRCVTLCVRLCTPLEEDWSVPLEAAVGHLLEHFGYIGALCAKTASEGKVAARSADLSAGLADAFVGGFKRLRDAAVRFDHAPPTDDNDRAVECVKHICSVCCAGLPQLQAFQSPTTGAREAAPRQAASEDRAAFVPLVPPPPFVPLAAALPDGDELTVHPTPDPPPETAAVSPVGDLSAAEHQALWRPCPRCEEVIPRSKDGPNAKRHPNTELFRCPNKCGHIEVAAAPMSAPVALFEALRRGVEFSPPGRTCSGCGRRMLKQASTGIKNKGRFKFECLVCRDYQWTA